MGEDNLTCCEPKFWVDLVISLVLVLFAGITSGLSLGLLSHSKVDLEVLKKSGLPKEQKNAAKILPIIKNESFLLCTLLIAKSLATEALPIFLDRIVPSWFAILVAVIFVVAFVEVIPQAVCSIHGLSFGAKFTFFVKFLFFIFFPVSYPISKILDWLLGKNKSAILRRPELKTLVDLHGVKAGKGGDLTDDETTIISGALGMMEKIAKDAMTPLSKAFSLDINSKLDMRTMKTIASKGHSRVPIYSDNPTNIIGLILVKNLMFYHPEDETRIKDLTIRRILRVKDDRPLYDVLKLFQEGHGHMAVVVKSQRDPKETSHKANESDPNLHSITIHSDLHSTDTNADGTVHFSPLDDSTVSPLGPSHLRIFLVLVHILTVNDVSGNRRTLGEMLQNDGYSEKDEISSHSLDYYYPMKQSRQSNRLDRDNGSISIQEIETLKSSFRDDEVIGIITMEDVLEELLQEQIRDETDHHVEIHDKIRVNFLHSRRSSSISPTTSFSSYYHTPMLGSPLSSYNHSSPGRRSFSSSRSASAIRSSILSHQFSSLSPRVSRKSDEAF